MRKIREILRLRHEGGLSVRTIATSLGISVGAVQNYLRGAAKAGVTWPVAPGLEDEQLYARMTPPQAAVPDTARYMPDMATVHAELRGEGVTLQLLWEEYRRQHSDCYSYPQFCRYYRTWAGRLHPTIRQSYRAGEKLFVDWAGPTIPVHDSVTGAILPAMLFVAALGASNYTFARAYANRKLPAWIDAHVCCYEYLGGVPELTVADNEKTGITHPCRYEPGLHPTYQDLATHYHTVMLPTRPRKPRDKAKVEAAVLFAERWIIAVLRHRTFHSLAELNQAIAELLVRLNERPFKKLPGNRRSMFEQVDRPALRPLPVTHYELAEWRTAKVNIDYHIQVDTHFYSVPYTMVHTEVEVRLTMRVVEVLYKGRRVATHVRSFAHGQATTDPAHRPKSHQRHLEWTPSRLIHWADTDVGPHCAQAVSAILARFPHPEQGYRACLGLMRLRRLYGHARLECACHRAVQADACTYRSIKSMLQTGLDRQPVATHPTGPVFHHSNVRGADYYQQPKTEEQTC
jgi:transposase